MGFNWDKIFSHYDEDYDPNRYHFNVGDVVKFDCGAIGIVRTAAVKWVDICIHKRSLVHRNFGVERVEYKDLPYVAKHEFIPAKYTINKTLKWHVGDVVEESNYGMIVYLYEETEHQCFYGFVLQSENKYYLHTGIYLPNPYRAYIAM